MDAKSIGAWQRAHPFRPFVLHLDSGVTFEVAHPENLGFSPDTPAPILWAEGMTMIDVFAVSAITHRSPSRQVQGD